MADFIRLRPVLAFAILLTTSLCTDCATEHARERTPDVSSPIIVSGASSRPISPYIYGQNYWRWSSVKSDEDEIRGTENLMRDLHLNVYRAGGGNSDAQYPDKWTEATIDRYIAYCREIGAEPVFQVPIRAGSVEKAMWCVDYCNLKKKYNVRYWIIGNEPDIYRLQGRVFYDVKSYITDFKSFARAMRSVDPSIKLIGPGLASEYMPGNSWLTPFLESCGAEVDIISFHVYPFSPDECTADNVMDNRENFRARIRAVRDEVNRLCGPGKPVAVMESHVTWSAHRSESVLSGSPQTFSAGLWVADVTGVAIEENLWSLAFWSTCEWWTVGFIDDITGKPRPSYYALQMFTGHFGGNLLHVDYAGNNISVYASRPKSDDRTILIVINKNNVPYPAPIMFRNFRGKINDRKYVFPELSITCLSIPDKGTRFESWCYTGKMAEKSSPPEYRAIR